MTSKMIPTISSVPAARIHTRKLIQLFHFVVYIVRIKLQYPFCNWCLISVSYQNTNGETQTHSMHTYIHIGKDVCTHINE